MNSQRRALGTSLVSWFGMALLYLPMIFVMLMSFNSNRQGQAWGHFTWDWYSQLLTNTGIRQATWNSLVVALASTLVSTLLGTLLAIGLHRTPFSQRWRRQLDRVIHLPVVTPDILLAIALVAVFGLLRELTPSFSLGMATLIMGHITFQISFVTLVVLSRLASIGNEQIEAARDLYANTWGAWYRVVLPQLTPAIIAGALLAFTLSLDDFIISFFVSGPQSQTIPLLIYGSLRRGLSPQMHALSSILFSATLLAVLAALLYQNHQNASHRLGTYIRRTSQVVGVLFGLGIMYILISGPQGSLQGDGTQKGVTVLTYSEYIDPAILTAFTEKTGYPVQLELYEAQEEMIGKLMASGTSPYDVIIASDVVIQQMIHLQLIAPIDSSQIPHRVHVSTRFKNLPFDPHNRYSWPYLWGSTGVLYRDSSISPQEWSWFHLFQAERQQGMFTLLDEGRSMLSIALKAAGFSANTHEPSALRQSSQILLRAKSSQRCLGFDGSVSGKDKVLSGMAWAAIVFNGEAMAAMVQDTSLQFAIPQEGSFLWIDAMTLSAKSQNPEGAHAFINYILDPQVGAQLANYVQYGTPNERSLPYLDSEQIQSTVIYPDSATLKRLEFLADPGPAAPLFDEAWTIVKSR